LRNLVGAVEAELVEHVAVAVRAVGKVERDRGHRGCQRGAECREVLLEQRTDDHVGAVGYRAGICGREAPGRGGGIDHRNGHRLLARCELPHVLGEVAVQHCCRAGRRAAAQRQQQRHAGRLADTFTDGGQ
jgi:hypothetical protein